MSKQPEAQVLRKVEISLTRPQITDTDRLQYSILSPTQQLLIKDDIAEIGTQLLALTLDPQNPSDFMQQNAFLKGQLDWLNYMLERSFSSEATLRHLAAQSAN